MSLRFFIDQCVPNSIIQTIHDAGHQVLVLRDYIPIESPDIAVIVFLIFFQPTIYSHFLYPIAAMLVPFVVICHVVLI